MSPTRGVVVVGAGQKLTSTEAKVLAMALEGSDALTGLDLRGQPRVWTMHDEGVAAESCD